MNTEAEPKLADLMGYNPVWFWVMIFIVLAIIFLTVFVLLRIKALTKKTKTPEPLYVGFSGEIDKAFVLVNSGKMSVNEACQRVSLVLREFIAQKTGVPANMMTLSDLQRAEAPPKLLENIQFVYPIIFNNEQVTNYDDFLKFMNSSRAVLDGWWG